MLPFSTGYCTNVHAGATLAETRENLERHALAVKAKYSPNRPMGVGLWLSATAAAELMGEGTAGRASSSTPLASSGTLIDGNGGTPRRAFPTDDMLAFRDWLAQRGLVPYTLNGFPYGDFHQQVVKHRVYEPTWWDPRRVHYTLQLVDILDQILPQGLEGSISTLPIAWGTPCPDRDDLEKAAFNLRVAAQYMHDLEEETGRLIYLCLEPEPGCVFSFSDDAVHFFQWQLFGHNDEDVVRRHVRICHDVCHAAVMFEDQAEVLRKYQKAGIEVGKVQVSAALRMDLDLFERPAEAERRLAVEELANFAEDRYLHQTVISRDGEEVFYEDLRLALEAEGSDPKGQWRVHFHVPIYLREFGKLHSTQEQIVQCLEAAGKFTTCRHFEVETYAWGVLPPELKQPDLAAGIAAELRWLEEHSDSGQKSIRGG